MKVNRFSESVLGALIAALALAAALSLAANRARAQDWPDRPVTHLSGFGFGSDADLALLCPQEGLAQPSFRNRRTGQIWPIADPRLKAVAAKVCRADLLAAGNSSTVEVTNNRAASVFVGFTGSIAWKLNADCLASGPGVEITAGHSCEASIPSATGKSRFCATPTGPAPTDCWSAQLHHQTMVETSFQASCFKEGSCIWYDISLIPSYCTDADWFKDHCAGTGGASYNYPVELSCPGEPRFTCRGPVGTKYGSANYPGNCENPGNPYPPHCVGNSAECVNAYFYPMFDAPEKKYQPSAVCPAERTLTITFLAGP